MRCVCIILLLTGSARADVALVPTVRADWTRACASRLRAAREGLIRLDPLFTLAEVSVREDRIDAPDETCHPSRRTVVELALAGYSADVSRFERKDGPRDEAWAHRNGAIQYRITAGRIAGIHIPLADGARALRFAEELRPVLDACITDTPPVPPPPGPPPVTELLHRCADARHPGCITAERAVWDLEHLCDVEGAHVGDDGRPGRSGPWLDAVTRLGPDATPLLLRLAGSPNAAARTIAARGLGRIRSERGRDALERLRDDEASAYHFDDGCVGRLHPVSEEARAALRRYAR
jgi:hypothetical protein